jgi:transposase
LNAELDELYSDSGRPSVAPEYVLRALLLQLFYSIRSERLLVEQIDYNLLFRWFVGLGMDDAKCLSRKFATKSSCIALSFAMNPAPGGNRRGH